MSAVSFLAESASHRMMWGGATYGSFGRPWEATGGHGRPRPAGSSAA